MPAFNQIHIGICMELFVCAECALYVDKCSYNTIHKIMYAYNINILSKDSDLSNYKKYFLVLMQSVMFLASYRIISSEALFILSNLNFDILFHLWVDSYFEVWIRTPDSIKCNMYFNCAFDIAFKLPTLISLYFDIHLIYH